MTLHCYCGRSATYGPNCGYHIPVTHPIKAAAIAARKAARAAAMARRKAGKL